MVTKSTKQTTRKKKPQSSSSKKVAKEQASKVSDTPEPKKTIQAQKHEKKEKKEKEVASSKPGRYWEAVGRRKTAVARVRLFTKGEKEIIVNGKPYQEYFTIKELEQSVVDPLVRMRNLEKFRVQILVSGGGIRGQAEAARHGISRALVKFNPDFKKRLKRAGFIIRDPRMKERKKFGLKSARRAPQWKKR